MEAKHTPGTWEMGIDGRVTSTYPSNNGKICSMEDRTHWTTQVVCKIETNLGSNVLNERQKADAKLILAAPDLLEALNIALLNCKNLTPEAQEFIDKAIKKATK
jgi:hypothetical protein